MDLEDYLYFVILPILAISVILIFIRLLKGPSIPDREVAVDLLVTIGIGLTAIYSILSEHSTFLDIGLLFGLIGFLGTVAYSSYLEKQKKK